LIVLQGYSLDKVLEFSKTAIPILTELAKSELIFTKATHQIIFVRHRDWELQQALTRCKMFFDIKIRVIQLWFIMPQKIINLTIVNADIVIMEQTE
jgi:hypothetical protein